MKKIALVLLTCLISFICSNVILFFVFSLEFTLRISENVTFFWLIVITIAGAALSALFALTLMRWYKSRFAYTAPLPFVAPFVFFILMRSVFFGHAKEDFLVWNIITAILYGSGLLGAYWGRKRYALKNG